MSLLSKIGLTPESACACGLASEEVPLLFEGAAVLVELRRAELAAAEQRVVNARKQVEATANRGAGEQSPGGGDIADARQELDASVAALNAIYGGLFDQLAATFSAEVRAALLVWKSNASEPLPAHFKVVSRTAEESKVLQEALRHVQARARAGLSADPSRRAIVTAAEANVAVVAAKSNLQTRAALIQGAWHTATQ